MGHRLNILGTLDLRDADGTSVSSILQQPRRLGLLVYLALADRDGMVKRDTLLGLFWPDTSQENGRRALSQAIHFLRKSLGRDAIIGRGIEDLALNPEIVECDAARFQAAVKAGDIQTAMASYAGDLLPGFFVSGTPEFDQWLSNARDALRRSAAEVFWSSAEEAKQQGHAVSAAASARRAAELASESESATRRLMEFLESIDDRAGALEAYDGLVRKLLLEYETTPSSKTRDIAERIRRNSAAPAMPEPEDARAVWTANRLRSLPWQDIRERSKTLTGALIIMVAFISLWGVGGRVTKSKSLRTDASVVILPPEVFDPAMRDATTRIMADASAALVAVSQLTVYADEKKDAHFRLEPKVTSHDGQLRISTRLIDISNGTVVRSAVFSAAAADTAALAALALDMSEFARKEMGRYLLATQVATLQGPNAEALGQSMLARIRTDSLRDQGLSEYALITLDRADSVLARALSVKETAALLVERAELAQERSWVHLLPPLLNADGATRAIMEGIRYADAALALEPRNAEALELRGLLTYGKFITRASDATPEVHREEAEKYLRAAVDLNPKAARALSTLGSILAIKGEYSEAYWAAERATAADTYLDVADQVTPTLFTASLETGDLVSANRWCADLRRRSGTSWSGAFCALELIARRDDLTKEDVTRAEAIVGEIGTNAVNAPFLPLVNSVLAVIYAKTGDEDAARALLATVNGPMSDEAQPFMAWALAELGGHSQARSVLQRYVGKNPSSRAGILRSVRFASLKN